MKYLKFAFIALLASVLVFTGCEKDEVTPDAEFIPENFKVDIPSSISGEASKKLSSSKDEVLQGDDIYGYLRTFIFVGEASAEIVQDIMRAIRKHGLNEAMSFSFQSDDDGRVKNVVITENSSFEGHTWEYELSMTDAESEANADQGMAMQVFWDRNPVDGIAILKPYNLNRTENPEENDVMYRVDYSETGDTGYSNAMIVYIAGLPVANPLQLPYAMQTLKIFAGKDGDMVDVFGNSNHPNAKFFNDDTGFNWAFTASGIEDSDIGVAEVGLPPSDLDETSREVILGDYALKTVFENQIYDVWPNILPEDLDTYLQNTEAPGYFGPFGFITGGTAPNDQYTEIEASMNELVPYNPIQVTNLTIEFK
ncbi:MAG: hypothetical protein U9N85_04710 [Bacteroidota bacterium]|nr:hypothetical protein [Bacteroidota bacterium]